MNIFKQLLANLQTARFWYRFQTVDEKWIYLGNHKRNHWPRSGQASEPVVKQGQFRTIGHLVC